METEETKVKSLMSPIYITSSVEDHYPTMQSVKLYYRILEYRDIFQKLAVTNLYNIQVELQKLLNYQYIRVDAKMIGRQEGCVINDTKTGEKVFIKEECKNMILLYYNHLFYLMGLSQRNCTILKQAFPNRKKDKFVYIGKDENYSLNPNNRKFIIARELYAESNINFSAWEEYYHNYYCLHENIEKIFRVRDVHLRNQGIVLKNDENNKLIKKGKIIDFQAPSADELACLITLDQIPFITFLNPAIFKVDRVGEFISASKRKESIVEKGSFNVVRKLALQETIKEYSINYSIELTDSQVEKIEFLKKDMIKYYEIKNLFKNAAVTSRNSCINEREYKIIGQQLESHTIIEENKIKEILEKESLEKIGNDYNIRVFCKDIWEILIADLYVEALNKKMVEQTLENLNYR